MAAGGNLHAECSGFQISLLKFLSSSCTVKVILYFHLREYNINSFFLDESPLVSWQCRIQATQTLFMSHLKVCFDYLYSRQIHKSKPEIII